MPFDSISAVLPAYNEEENIENAAKRMAEALRSLDVRDWEVIIVDDGSVDQTGKIADDLGDEDPAHIRVFHHSPNRGYLLVRIMFRIGVRDIDCAFKLFRREVFDKVTIESKKFFVNAEVLAKAKHFGFRLAEVGVRHYPRAAGRSTVRPSHVVSTLRELAHIWINVHSKSRGKR